MPRADLAAFLVHYGDDLLVTVAGKLFRPRINEPADQLIPRIVATWSNPPVIDRLLKSLPQYPNLLMAALGRSRQLRWSVQDCMTLCVAFGSTDGFADVATLLDRGLIVAESDEPFASFSDWYAREAMKGMVQIPEPIATRAASQNYALDPPQTSKVKAASRPGDMLDWPLRLTAARQEVRTLPVKMTQAGSLYKRDHGRFTGDGVLTSALENSTAPVQAGLLALHWARSSGLLTDGEDLTASAWPDAWSTTLPELLTDLFAGFFGISNWDPLTGLVTEAPCVTATAALLLVLRLSEAPTEYLAAQSLADWLWDRHPHWSGIVPKALAETHGRAWIEACFNAIFTPLGITDSVVVENACFLRLTDLGRHLLANGPPPAPPPAIPQTLLVQPNGEILVYRQGLTPAIIARLSSFAKWKQIGAACTLELSADSVTRGLEDGLKLADIQQSLERHGLKPTPPNVADLLRRWADKRERLVVYPSATLVEFLQPADLDQAISRGIVNVRLTDRIGLTANGRDPDFSHLRLVGNRDYEAKPSACVVAEDDGVTLRVDAAAADLLLDAEITRFAEPLPMTSGEARRYRMSPASLRAAAEHGQSLETLDEWFAARSGEGLPAAAKLFLLPPFHAGLQATRMMVVEVPTSEIADGLLQWPLTAGYALRRLGPTAFVVSEDQVPALQERLASIGLALKNGE